MNAAKLVNPVLTERKQNKVNTAIFTFFHLHSIPWITLIFILASCNTTQPPPVSKGKIQLTVEDVSSTEVWLNVKTQNITLPAELKLFREDSVTQIINMSSTDTLLYDNDLQPNKTYNYKATYTGSSAGGGQTIQSQTVTATTMDTTSHNFTWQTYTFGGANGSSVLNDVAIINENDIWAVGEIHTADTDQFDSSGVWVQPYNAVHWDGNTWELKRIMFYIDQDQPSAGKTSSPCQTSFVFSYNEFAITSNVQTAIFNSTGDYQIIKMGFEWKDRFGINSMWGTSSSDFYIVGNNGNIAHYNGSTWTKINSPTGVNSTDLDIYDIWGDYDEKKGEYEILAVAAKILQSTDRDILKISNTGVEKLDETGINWSLHGIWFKSGRKYYAVGSGIYRKNKLSNTGWNNNWQQITPYYINSVRGNAINDVFMCGAFGEVLHFNGQSWHSYINKELPFFNGSLMKISYKGNTVCIVGSDGRVGIIYLGKRN